MPTSSLVRLPYMSTLAQRCAAGWPSSGTGSRGMTASQRRAVVSVCTGIQMPDEDGYGGAPIAAPAPMPVPPPAPSSVTNCDAGGCWDNLGGRYTRSAGNTYFPTTGGPPCQMIGGMMRCP